MIPWRGCCCVPARAFVGFPRNLSYIASPCLPSCSSLLHTISDTIRNCILKHTNIFDGIRPVNDNSVAAMPGPSPANPRAADVRAVTEVLESYTGSAQIPFYEKLELGSEGGRNYLLMGNRNGTPVRCYLNARDGSLEYCLWTNDMGRVKITSQEMFTSELAEPMKSGILPGCAQRTNVRNLQAFIRACFVMEGWTAENPAIWKDDYGRFLRRALVLMMGTSDRVRRRSRGKRNVKIEDLSEDSDEEPLDEEPSDEEPFDEEPAFHQPFDEEPFNEEPLGEEPEQVPLNDDSSSSSPQPSNSTFENVGRASTSRVSRFSSALSDVAPNTVAPNKDAPTRRFLERSLPRHAQRRKESTPTMRGNQIATPDSLVEKAPHINETPQRALPTPTNTSSAFLDSLDDTDTDSSPELPIREELINSYIAEENQYKADLQKMELAKRNTTTLEEKLTQAEKKKAEIEEHILELNTRRTTQKREMDQTNAEAQNRLKRLRRIKGEMTGEEGYQLAKRTI